MKESVCGAWGGARERRGVLVAFFKRLLCIGGWRVGDRYLIPKLTTARTWPALCRYCRNPTGTTHKRWERVGLRNSNIFRSHYSWVAGWRWWVVSAGGSGSGGGARCPGVPSDSQTHRSVQVKPFFFWEVSAYSPASQVTVGVSVGRGEGAGIVGTGVGPKQTVPRSLPDSTSQLLMFLERAETSAGTSEQNSFDERKKNVLRLSSWPSSVGIVDESEMDLRLNPVASSTSLPSSLGTAPVSEFVSNSKDNFVIASMLPSSVPIVPVNEFSLSFSE